MNVDNKKEILFYYESKANPNGDPGFDDQPRLMNDGTIMVTDLRLKRTIRDHAKNNLNKTIFVDYDKFVTRRSLSHTFVANVWQYFTHQFAFLYYI